MSLSSLPNAPGAPFGQSGFGSFTSARNCITNESLRTEAKRVFIFSEGELTQISWRDNEELRESIQRASCFLAVSEGTANEIVPPWRPVEEVAADVSPHEAIPHQRRENSENCACFPLSWG